MSKDKEVLVKFLKHYTPYAKGDVTAIDGEKFEELKKAGIVEKKENKKTADKKETQKPADTDGDKDKKADKDKKDGDKDKK